MVENARQMADTPLVLDKGACDQTPLVTPFSVPLLSLALSTNSHCIPLPLFPSIPQV